MAPRLLAVACALLVLVACTVENTADKSKAKPPSKGEIRIGVDLPLSGGEAVDGRSTLNGVKFAVQQANDRGGVAGFHLSVREFDDAVNGVHNPARGGDNVKRIIADGTILGMVGPLESNVAQVQIPIANEARLAMISPAAVNECLTKNLAYCRPGPAELRPSAPNNFFRVSPTSDLQGPAMADYALDRLKLQRVAVASDGEIYGKSLADSFADRFTKRGGKVVRTENFDIPTTSDFKPFLTAAREDGAAGIYFGGTDSNKGCQLRAQMKGIFPVTVPELGSEGIVTAECLRDAGDYAEGIHASVAGVDPGQLPAAKPVLQAFTGAYSRSDDYGYFTLPAYDAASILIEAMGRAITSAGGKLPTRDQVRAEVAKTKNHRGALGLTSFDVNGDTSLRTLAVYASKGKPSDWKFVAHVATAPD